MIVVDTNVIVYLLVSGEFTEKAIAVRRRDSIWVAPGLWESEMRNVLILYLRRDLITIEKAEAVMKKAEDLIQSYSVGSSSVLRNALDSGCTAYDCEFIELSKRLESPLVTQDKKILAAFPEIAVTMADFISL